MKRKTLLFLLSIAMFSGCSTIDPHLTSDLQTPQNYEANTTTQTLITDQWWKDFHAEYLDSLIEEALAKSPDLLASYEKINQATLAVNSAGAAYLPSIDLRGSSSKNRKYPHNADAFSSSSTSGEISLSYELDVWGKIAANIRLAKSNASMSIYDYEAVRLALIASIIENYFNYVATVEQINIAEKNLEIAQKVLKVMEVRFQYGSINELDLRRQQTTLFSQEAGLLSLQNQRLGYKNALAILLGKVPSAFEIKTQEMQSIIIPSVGAGLPSDLLYRRPDIAAQKAAIESSEASIEVANAARYPSFSLSASGGSSSNELLSFTNPTHAIAAGLSMSYNIFDDGRLKNEKLSQESKAQAVLQEYKKTVLTAFKEVEDALNNVSYNSQNFTLTKKILIQSEENFKLASLQYQNGMIDFTTFLDTQLTFFSAQEELIVAKKQNLNASVALYKALGGGFSIE